MIKKQDIRLAATVGLALIATGYLMNMLGDNQVIAQARQGLGG
jgi:hypothetical protein